MVYFAKFPGMWMEGYAVVLAQNETRVKEMVMTEAASQGIKLSQDQIVVIEASDENGEGIISFYNGDY